MPNWVYISATISHNDPAKMVELTDTSTDQNTFEHFLPIPKEVIEPTDPDLAAKGITTLGNAEFSWRCDHWGTKWDIGTVRAEQDSLTLVQIGFETAWTPPLPVFEQMRRKGYTIEAEYWEEGGFFVGTWMDGVSRTYKPEDAPPELAHLVAHYADEDEDDDAEAA